jgi:putative heme-binding domain-containing protein
MRSLTLFFVFVAAVSAQMLRPPRAADDPKMTEIEKKYISNPEAVTAGKELYLLSCSGCHGPNGEGGRGPNLLTGRQMRRMNHQRLFDTIRNGLPGTDMPPFALPDEETWKITAFVRSLTAPAVDTPVPGDPKAGETVFFGKGGCFNCHMIRGKGGYLGPDLSNAGFLSYAAQLQKGLLDANDRITDGFDPVRVTLQDGKILEGVAKNYTNYSLQLLDKQGRLHLLQAADLKQITFLKKTWMPDDYEKRLSREEIENVLAYLSRQVTRRPGRSGPPEEEE